MNKNRSDGLVGLWFLALGKVLETVNLKRNQMVTQIEPGILSSVSFKDILEATDLMPFFSAFFIAATENLAG